jgi:hypothetical protein
MIFSVKLLENKNIIISGDFSGFLDNNIINYNDGVNNVFDLNRLVLERICDDYKIVFDFSNSNCEYITNELSVNMMLDVDGSKICSNSLFFKYKIVDTGNIYEYSVKW